jgi:hypothetical protein
LPTISVAATLRRAFDAAKPEVKEGSMTLAEELKAGTLRKLQIASSAEAGRLRSP